VYLRSIHIDYVIFLTCTPEEPLTSLYQRRTALINVWPNGIEIYQTTKIERKHKRSGPRNSAPILAAILTRYRSYTLQGSKASHGEL
jgi:hypothetical protein